MCTKQDQDSEKCIQTPVSHALSDYHICHATWAPCQESHFSSSSMNCMSIDSIIEVFYHLNKMLTATKHIADHNFVFQLDSALAHLACNIVQISQLHFF